MKLGNVSLVSVLICLKFCRPSRCIFNWRCRQLATKVPVPKAPVNKDHHAATRHADIWPSGQVPTVQPEPITRSMQSRPNEQFRSGILSTDPRHHPRAGSCVNDTHNQNNEPILQLGAR